MAENSLLSRLDGIDARFEEVSTLITDPSVIADMKRYVRLNKEYKDLERLTSATNRYRALLANIAEAKELLESETDSEMREMAHEQLDEANDTLPQLEEEIKLLLIPADPEDAKNAIVEIRGGTGGDEAALFAGDLFKMYSRYCESKGWQVAVTSFNEGTAGGFKEIVFAVTGDNVYGTLKYESGVHRVQRVPATETQGVCTLRQPRLPFCQRPKRSMWKSTKAKSSGKPSEAAEPVVRMSTRWSRACAFAICGVIQTQVLPTRY